MAAMNRWAVMNRWVAMAMLGLAFAVVPAATESRADEGVGDFFTASIPPSGQDAADGAFELLSPGNRKIALALFDAQGASVGNDVAWTLDGIAAAKRAGVAWSSLFVRMRAEGLIDQPNLGAVISRAVGKWNARPAKGDGNRAPAARRGAYKTLAAADREIATALFEGQSIGRAGRHAWSIDQIGTARQNGARWQEVLRRMRADELIQARTIDGLIRPRAGLVEAARALRKVVITNGMGRHVVITTRSRPRGR